MIASVIVDVKTDSVNHIFDYLIPSYLETTIKVGQRVSVPFGFQKLLGFVVDIKNETSFNKNLKEIDDVLDIVPCLNKELMFLADNMHKYYYSLYINCLLTMIPAALRAKYQKKFVVVNRNLLPIGLDDLFKDDEVLYSKKILNYMPLIQDGLKNKSIIIENEISDKEKIQTKKYVQLNEFVQFKLNSNQQEIVNYFKELNTGVLKSEAASKFSTSRINLLIDKGVLKEYELESRREFDKNKKYVDKKVTLNSEQEIAYNTIKASYNTNKTILLHGVTGSGKTEIYLSVMEDVLKSGKEAILLVPEISLTPQIVGRIKARFGKNVAVLHSGLSIGEKYDEWRKVINKEVKIVVGARSAIFAPFENLGIIIIDEEHEASYRQFDSDPRYDARIIARIRARNHSIPIILGSATPSIESYYQAKNGKFELIELKERANHKDVPKIELVDMRNELKNGNHSIFSNKLQELINDRLIKNEQTILLLNRRGFSSFVMCRECGEVVKCPHCEVSLTYHKKDDSLMCHYCGYKQKNISFCPSCKSKKVRFVGMGTEKVVEECNKLYPNAKVLRMDADNTRKKGAHESIISAFLKGEADILVGTQMISKGLDFPKCSLVGILNSDIALKYPTYTAPTEAYNLFVQTSGRAGRHKTEGKVILQGYDIDHYAVQAAKNDDYESFYNQEIKYRKLGGYPPYVKLIEMIVIGKDYQKTYDEAAKISNYILSKTKVNVLGPSEDFIVKINDEYRFKIVLKFNEEKIINQVLEILYAQYETNKQFKLFISRT